MVYHHTSIPPVSAVALHGTMRFEIDKARAARLALARRNAGFESGADFSRAYGIADSTYRSAENGTRPLTLEFAEKVAKALRIRPAWLLWGEGPMSRHAAVKEHTSIRMSGIIGAGQKVIPDPDFSDRISLSLDGEAAEAFEVRGESMLPVAHEGDVLFFGWPQPPANLIGCECIVETVSGERYFKMLAHGSKPELFTLMSYNAKPIIDVKIARAGELLAILRRS